MNILLALSIILVGFFAEPISPFFQGRTIHHLKHSWNLSIPQKVLYSGIFFFKD